MANCLSYNKWLRQHGKAARRHRGDLRDTGLQHSQVGGGGQVIHAGHVWTGTSARPILPRMVGHDVTSDSLELCHVVEATSCSCIKGITSLLGHLCCLVWAERGGGLRALGGWLWTLC